MPRRRRNDAQSQVDDVRASYSLGFPEDGLFAASLGLPRGDMLPVILISFVFNLVSLARSPSGMRCPGTRSRSRRATSGAAELNAGDLHEPIAVILGSTCSFGFSLRTLAAAMLAPSIALWLDMPNPYWAMASVFITSNPLTGATCSKAVYPILGTLTTRLEQRKSNTFRWHHSPAN